MRQQEKYTTELQRLQHLFSGLQEDDLDVKLGSSNQKEGPKALNSLLVFVLVVGVFFVVLIVEVIRVVFVVRFLLCVLQVVGVRHAKRPQKFRTSILALHAFVVIEGAVVITRHEFAPLHELPGDGIAAGPELTSR